MKQNQIVKILAAEFQTVDVAEINKLLRQKNAPQTKYRFSGENLGHLGVTGVIKMITSEGVKVTGSTRTVLVRFEDIEDCAKAKPRSERSVYAEPKKTAPTKKSALELALADDDEDDGDYSELLPIAPKKRRSRSAKPQGKSGSRFIPKAKK